MGDRRTTDALLASGVLVKLIEEGKLQCRLVGRHRRIKMADLMAYKQADTARRRAVLDELAAEAQKHGLG